MPSRATSHRAFGPARRAAIHGALAAVVVAALASCATWRAPESTRLTDDDLIATTDAMATKLGESDFLRERGPGSDPIVIAINKVQNLTSDIIPEREQWWMMARVRDRLNVNALRRERAVAFVVPKEFLVAGREAGAYDEVAAMGRAPTHAMEATFRSATRSGGRARADAYLCEYRITDLADSGLCWTDTFEFKKAALGRSYD